MMAKSWPPTATRWLKFNLVGGMGIAVQLLMLIALKSGLRFNYLIATALAVETAVIHNYWCMSALPGPTALDRVATGS